jgi:hypothetical protein
MTNRRISGVVARIYLEDGVEKKATAVYSGKHRKPITSQNLIYTSQLK